MKILSTFSPEFDRIKLMYSRSLHHRKIETIFKKITDKQVVDNFGYGTEYWYRCLKEKILFYLEYMTHCDDVAVCCSDIDIVFFNKQKLIMDFNNFISSPVDILACREKKTSVHMNSGFFMIKNSSKTRDLLKEVIDMDLSKFRLGDQDAINYILNTNYSSIKYTFLNEREYILNCMFKKNNNFYLKDKDSVVMFHATCCRSVRKKYIAMKNFKNLME